MVCKTCENLLTTYDHAVRLFTHAVQNVSDIRRLARDAKPMEQNCKDASDALMAHLREHRSYVA